MKLNVRLTKKTKIILLGIFVFVLAGTGGYLLWRVNQPNTVAPTDSDATGGVGACCGTPGCVAGWKCDTSQSCGETKTVTCTNADIGKKMACPSYKGATATNAATVAGITCQSVGQTATCRYSFGPGGSTGGTCVKESGTDEPIGGTCPDKIKACEWPKTIMSSTCSCELCNGTNGCTGNPPTCTPGGCPSGYESCGVSGSEGKDSDCKIQTDIKCVVYHPDCNNPSNIYRYCRPIPVNTCDSGAWITKPSGSYAHCTNIDYSAKATDSDGIDESSVSVKLNSASRANVKKSTSGTSTTISETLSTTTDCLAPGSYTLAMDWKDSKGATSTNCALSTTFTVQAAVVTNTCDSGTWITRPTGSYPYCGDISYSAKATDSDGIDESSISVRLNDQNRLNFSKSTSGTSTTISETLSNATNCLAPGSYTLAMDWKDTLGAASTNCALNTSFIVQPQVLNPNWSLVKGVVEKCIDESTTNPSSQLTYTVTLKNKGTGEGQITKIVDTLDSKVLASYLSNISNSGVYAGGNITWTLSDTDKVFAAGQEKIFTYVVTVPKDTFGTYANTVTAYPATGENIVANAEIAADCMVEVPGTGLLDSTVAKIVLGAALILFGINFSRVTDLTRKLSISINDATSERRKKNFEKRVVKR